MTFLEYCKLDDNFGLGVKIFIGILGTLAVLSLFHFIWLMPLIGMILITLFDIVKTYYGYRKIKQPTWAVLKYIRDNAGELVDDWAINQRVVKDGVRIYGRSTTKNYNPQEQDLIDKYGTGRLREIRHRNEQEVRDKFVAEERAKIMEVMCD